MNYILPKVINSLCYYLYPINSILWVQVIQNLSDFGQVGHLKNSNHIELFI